MFAFCFLSKLFSSSLFLSKNFRFVSTTTAATTNNNLNKFFCYRSHVFLYFLIYHSSLIFPSLTPSRLCHFLLKIWLFMRSTCFKIRFGFLLCLKTFYQELTLLFTSLWLKLINLVVPFWLILSFRKTSLITSPTLNCVLFVISPLLSR